jgi:AraC family transcriptional regulator
VALVQNHRFVRSVGGKLTSSFIAEVGNARIEMLQRETTGRVHWRFRQPSLTLLWWRSGMQRLNARIDGRRVTQALSPQASLGIFPPDTLIEAELEVSPCCDYAIAFIDPAFVYSRIQARITEPIAGFSHEALERGLSELREESGTPDGIFDLLFEGWTIQALGHMARVSGACSERTRVARGGLPGRSARRLDEYVRSNLSQRIELAELSGVSGLSKRQLLRAFPQTFGQTPHRYVLSLRVDEAKRRLADTEEPITDIALSCGFVNAQHFATRFRKATSLTPSEYRRRHLS